MTTYILRHGQTAHSQRYLVNGDLTQLIPLSEEGQRAAIHARSAFDATVMRTWVASEFPRTQQTASLLMNYPPAPLVVDARLNELDYGDYEGGPFLDYAVWLEHHGASQLPPGARESQQEGIRRMLVGVLAALQRPGPRVLVCHGLLVSVLLWHRDRSPGTPMPLFFPEAPCADPLAVPDDRLSDWIGVLLAKLEAAQGPDQPGLGEGGAIPICDGSAIATVTSVSRPPDQKDLPHA